MASEAVKKKDRLDSLKNNKGSQTVRKERCPGTPGNKETDSTYSVGRMISNVNNRSQIITAA